MVRLQRLLPSLPGLARQLLAAKRARAELRAPAQLPLLSIETTAECNARCGMCGFPTAYPPGDRLLSTAELLALVDQAGQLGTRVLSLGGGEPLLRDDADRVIEQIARRGMTPFLHSNGSLLDPERRRWLADRSSLILALSLDSHRRDTHDQIRNLPCFDAAVAAARYFTVHAPAVRVAITFTITAMNFRDMLATARLAHDLGVRAIRFTPVHGNLQHRFKPPAELAPFLLAPSQLTALGDQIEQVIAFTASRGMVTNSTRFLRAIPDAVRGRVAHDCYAGFLFASIDPWGNLFPCYDHTGGIDVRRHGGLGPAFYSAEMDELRRRVAACGHCCWNVGTAEPSLRLDRSLWAGDAPRLVRESLFFLA